MTTNMNKYSRIFLIVLQLAWTSCATPYQKLKKNGGYSEEKINDHVYRVSFIGNQRTKKERVQQYFLRRSAEVAMREHFDYFLIIEEETILFNSENRTEGSAENQSKITTFRYSNDEGYFPEENKNLINYKTEGKIIMFKDGDEPIKALKVKDILIQFEQ